MQYWMIAAILQISRGYWNTLWGDFLRREILGWFLEKVAYELNDEEKQAIERVGSSRGDIICMGTSGSKAKKLN